MCVCVCVRVCVCICVCVCVSRRKHVGAYTCACAGQRVRKRTHKHEWDLTHMDICLTFVMKFLEASLAACTTVDASISFANDFSCCSFFNSFSNCRVQKAWVRQRGSNDVQAVS